jgi:uroporphyrinogen-III synthase
MAFAVLTRDPADAVSYGSALAPLEIVPMPVTRTVELADALVDLYAAVDVVVVMSPRAAHMVVKGKVKAPAVWAVGPATKRALEIARVAAHVPADVVDGAGLARALVKQGVAGKRVLVPRAEEGRTEPLEILRAAGAEVIDVIAYRTVPVPAEDPAIQRGRELLAGGEAAVCCVFAPSQVAALAQIVRLPDVRTRMCAIGETTAAAARAAGVSEVAVAATPTPEGIAHAVRSVYPIGR